MEDKDLCNRFTYHPPKEGQPEDYVDIRDNGLAFARLINSICPDSREKSSAISRLEEVVMWANAAIAQN